MPMLLLLLLLPLVICGGTTQHDKTKNLYANNPYRRIKFHPRQQHQSLSQMKAHKWEPTANNVLHQSKKSKNQYSSIQSYASLPNYSSKHAVSSQISYSLNSVTRAPRLSISDFNCPESKAWTAVDFYNKGRNMLQAVQRGQAPAEALQFAQRFLCCSIKLNSSQPLAWAYRALSLPGIATKSTPQTENGKHKSDTGLLSQRHHAVKMLIWGLKLSKNDPEILWLLIDQIVQIRRLQSQNRVHSSTLSGQQDSNRKSWPYDYQSLLIQTRDAFINYASDNPAHWYKRGVLLEKIGARNHGKNVAERQTNFTVGQMNDDVLSSFAEAWRLDPDNDRYSNKMYVLRRQHSRTTSEAATLHNSFSKDIQLANYKHWLDKMKKIGRMKSMDNKTDDDIHHPPAKHYKQHYYNQQHCLRNLKTWLNINIEAEGGNGDGRRDFDTLLAHEQTVMVSMREALKKALNRDDCMSIDKTLSAANTRIGLMYSLPNMSITSKVTPVSLGLSGAPFSPPWHFFSKNVNHRSRKSSNNNADSLEQRFPAYLVNLMISICSEKKFSSKTHRSSPSIHELAWLMDSEAIRMESTYRKNTSWLDQQDEFGNTAAHLAAMQVDALTLKVLITSGSDLTNIRNMWGATPLDILMAWQSITPQIQLLYDHLQLFHCTKNVSLQPHYPLDPFFSSKNIELNLSLTSVYKQPSGWMYSAKSTVDWGPLATWEDPGQVDVVDGRQISLQDVIHDYISMGRPVVIRNALLTDDDRCAAAIRLWNKDTFLQTSFAIESRYNSYRIPYGNSERGESAPLLSIAEFVQQHMRNNLTNESKPRYIFDNRIRVNEDTESQFMPSNADPLSRFLQCIPFELQQYFSLPPAGLSGAWRQWTLGFGGSGSGAPFHLHEQAINVVLHGTKRWFIMPPNRAEYRTMPIFEWLRDEYQQLSPTSRPLQFVQKPGDIVVLPAWWAHATVSIDDCISISRVLANPIKSPSNHNPVGPMQDNLNVGRDAQKEFLKVDSAYAWPIHTVI